MFISNWKKEVFTIPNLLSLFRLALIPVYVGIYLNAKEPQEYVSAAVILAVSCLTDLVDGFIARRFHMVSVVGKILDPIADKLTQFTLTICLSVKYPMLQFVLLLFVIKEVFQVVMGLIHLRRGHMLPGALAAGKVCTAVLFLSLIVLVLFPQLDMAVVDIIAITDICFLSNAFVHYFFAYFSGNSQIQDIQE